MKSAVPRIMTKSTPSIDFGLFFKVGRSNFQPDSREYKVDQLVEKVAEEREEFLELIGRDVARFRRLMRSEKSQSTGREVFSLYRKIYHGNKLAQSNHFRSTTSPFNDSQSTSLELESLGNQYHQLQFKDHCDFLSFLLHNKSPRLSAKFLQDHFLPKLYEYKNLDARQIHTILMVFLNAGQTNQVALHFDYIQSLWNRKPTAKAYTILMMAYFKEKRYDLVEATWKSSVNTWPELYFLNQEAWAILLDCKSNQREFGKAEKWYQVLKSNLPKSVPIASCVSEAVIRLYVKSGNVEKALKVFESMKIDAQDFIKSFSEGSNQEMNRFDQCFHTYHSLIQVCFETNHNEIALKYFYKCLEVCQAVDQINKVMTRPPPPTAQSRLEHFPAKEVGYLPHLKNQHPNPETVSILIKYYSQKKEYEKVIQWHHYFQCYVRLNDRARQDVVRAYLALGLKKLAIKEWKRIVGGYIIADEDLQSTMNQVMQEEENCTYFN